MIDILTDPVIVGVFYTGLVVLAFVLLWHWVID